MATIVPGDILTDEDKPTKGFASFESDPHDFTITISISEAYDPVGGRWNGKEICSIQLELAAVEELKRNLCNFP